MIKDPLKSLAWQTLGKEKQEALIQNYSNKRDRDFGNSELKAEIHQYLGTETADFELIKDLKEVLVCSSGTGIYKELENYVERFDNIYDSVIVEWRRRNGLEGVSALGIG